MNYLLIVVFVWSMAYRGEQVTPVNLGTFKTAEACQAAANQVSKALGDRKLLVMCTPEGKP